VVRLPDSWWRALYIVAFPIYRRVRLWTGRARGGAFVAVRAPDDVLVVRHSYRPRVDFVGGGIRKGETARTAACRELAEEVGLEATPDALRQLGVVRRGFRAVDEQDVLFEWRVEKLPTATVDNREIVWAGGLRDVGFDRREHDLTVRWYLRRFGSDLEAPSPANATS